MQLEIRATNFGLEPGVRNHIERRIMMSLDRYAPRVGRVEVVVTNMLGRNHVRQLQCRVLAKLLHAQDVVVEQTDADLVTAVDRAAGRLKRTVRRYINRRRASARRENQSRARFAA